MCKVWNYKVVINHIFEQNTILNATLSKLVKLNRSTISNELLCTTGSNKYVFNHKD